MEFVFVTPRRELFADCYPQGFSPFRDAEERRALEGIVARRGFFVEREAAERNPEWKQIIPYTVVIHDGEILLLRRLAAGGERRLHEKLSIGVGGHINPEDLEDSGRRNAIAAGTHRELHEELFIEDPVHVRPLGILNDDSNPVGAVHLGWVQTVWSESPVRVREEDLLEGRFASVEDLRRRKAAGENFETWSAILIDRIDEFATVDPIATR